MLKLGEQMNSHLDGVQPLYAQVFFDWLLANAGGA